ncbi:MAG: hypothetical protein QM723_11995 [Myxococcaceae bacterium]
MRRFLSAVAVLGVACGGGGGPPVGDGGGSDGLPPAGDGGLVRPVSGWAGLEHDDPQGYALLTGLELAGSGETADLDGDGFADIVSWRDDDGTLEQWYVVGRASWRPLWALTRFLDGRVLLQIDRNENTTKDIVIETDPKAGTRVEQYDDDYDETFEFRRTLTDDLAAGTRLVVEETYDTTAMTWSESKRFTVSLGANACNGLSNYPGNPFVSPTLVAGGAGEIRIITDDPDVKCSPTQEKAVRKAVACAAKKAKECLVDSNAELSSKLLSTIASSHLEIGCNNPCPAADATTLNHWMNVRPDWDTLGDDVACAVMMHELMHYSDVQRDETHDDGVDRIYSCSRYCNKCLKRGPASPQPTDMQDCVACAGTAAERENCGHRQQITTGPCSTGDICHAGLAGNLPCDVCRQEEWQDCAGNSLGGGTEFVCCELCPSGYTSPEEACTGPTSVTDTCMQQPPKCP